MVEVWITIFLLLWPTIVIYFLSTKMFTVRYPTPPHLSPLPERNKDNLLDADTWIVNKSKGDCLKKSNLWRVNGKYYDLTDFAKQHPGGEDWINVTRGHDCTDAFEVHHLNITKASLLLQKYLVKDIPEEDTKDFRFTFDPKGFYCTLRERVFAKLGNNIGPTNEMKIVCAIYLLLWCFSFQRMCSTSSMGMAVIAGVLLTPIWGMGHNFLHQKDTPLRFLFNLTCCSAYKWRITHAISHHLYPNTQLDFEVEAIEPFIIYFTSIERNPIRLILTPFLCQVFFCSALIVDFIKNIVSVIIGRSKNRLELWVPLVELIILQWYCSFWRGLALWLVMHAVNSFLLLSTSFGLHHGPTIWHDGDLYERKLDYGEHILKTTRDHTLGNIAVSLGLFMFLNDHTLHHFFPTVDHSRFNEIRDIFASTSKEFGIHWKVANFKDLYFGIFQRMITNASKE